MRLLITYLVTPWCRVLLEKLTGLQLVKKLPAFHVTRRFITALTSVRRLSLSWARPIQSIYTHPTSWRSILILSTHLCLGLPSGLLPSSFPTKTLYTPLSSTHSLHMPSPSQTSRFYHILYYIYLSYYIYNNADLQSRNLFKRVIYIIILMFILRGFWNETH